MKRFAVFLYLSLWKLHYLALKLRHIDRGQTHCQFNTISSISNKGRGKEHFMSFEPLNCHRKYQNTQEAITANDIL